jgi:hypothetical protein
MNTPEQSEVALNERIEPRALTLGALAVELDADRRTVAKALREAGAAPVAERNGHACYTVAQALDALARRADRVNDRRLDRFRRAPPEPAPWVAAIDQYDLPPFERGFCVGLVRAIYVLPRVVAGVGVNGVGLTMSQAFDLSRGAVLGLMHLAFGEARDAGVHPFADSGEDGPEIIALSGFVPIGWERLARERGEPGWRPASYGPGWNTLDPDSLDGGEGDDGEGADDA